MAASNSNGFDDDGNELDYCRLYICSIPKDLNPLGLQNALSKYGELQEFYVSPDPKKRFGLVRFSSPSEAKLAMMTLNHTEPMKLHITIAKKSSAPIRKNMVKSKGDGRRESERGRRERRETRQPQGREHNGHDGYYGDSTSDGGTGMFGIMPAVPSLIPEDDVYEEFEEELDPDLELALAQARIRYKQRMRDLAADAQMAGRPIRDFTPDGRIVVRTGGDRAAASAGCDSPPPGLRTAASCVACGMPADSFCERCRLTPYCSAQCQRRDWGRRHRAVCHNLASETPQLAPLRRPRDDDTPQRRNDDAPRRNGGDNDRYTKPRQQNGYNPNKKAPTDFQNQAIRNQDKPVQNRNPNQDNRSPHSGKENQNNRAGQNRFQNQDSRGPGGFQDKGQNGSGTRQPGMRPPLRHEAQNNAQLPETKPFRKPQCANAEKPANIVATSPNVVTTSSSVAQQLRDSVTPAPPTSPPTLAKSPKSVERTSVEQVAAKEHPLMAMKCLISQLEAGATLLATVQGPCPGGHVCTVVSALFGESYTALCEPYSAACEAEAGTCKPTPGDLFSYFVAEEGAWYRALCLSADRAALLDAGREVPLKDCRVTRLDSQYRSQPIFAAVLNAEGVKPGVELTCTITSKSGGVAHVTVSSGGNGTFTKWLPKVDDVATVQPQKVAAAAPSAVPDAAAAVSEVPRPSVRHGSEVTIVSVLPDGALLLREVGDREFDQTVSDALLSGLKAAPLTSPPTKGALVLAKFTDGNIYRALVTRTNVKLDKYMIEYVEYGNTEVKKQEQLLQCPDELTLTARPTRAAKVTLHGLTVALTQEARDYLVSLKNQEATATLTLPLGAATAPSGSAVTLTLTRGAVSVNKKAIEMSTPEWQALEKKGVDILKTPVVMLKDLTYLPLPETGCTLQVLDSSLLEMGALSGCDAARAAEALLKLDELTQQMTEYCESEYGGEQYLPRAEELCIAQFEGAWYRAVKCEQPGGPGGDIISVMYVDYGNDSNVRHAQLRRMLPSHIEMPAIAVSVEIQDFPASPSPRELEAARAHIAQGTVRLTSARLIEPGLYVASAPDLIAAMMQGL